MGLFTPTFKRKLDDLDWTTMEYFWTDEDYLDNMKIELIAEYFFKIGLENSNENKTVINQQSVNKFNFESAQAAIGQELILRNCVC